MTFAHFVIYTNTPMNRMVSQSLICDLCIPSYVVDKFGVEWGGEWTVVVA